MSNIRSSLTTRVITEASRISAAAAGIAVLAMMLHVVLSVAERAILGTNTVAAITIVPSYYMVFLAFLPLGICEWYDRNISVELVTQLLSPRWESAVRAFSTLLVLFVLGLLIYTSLQEAINAQRIGRYVLDGTNNIPTWPAYYALPFGFALAFIVSLKRLADYVGAAMRGEPFKAPALAGAEMID